MTGMALPALASYDRIVPDLMAKWKIPGAAVAVVKDGRLVLARGYGWADREGRQSVQPDSLFRIASLSKSLTVAAILKLVEDEVRYYAYPGASLAESVFPAGPAKVPWPPSW